MKSCSLFAWRLLLSLLDLAVGRRSAVGVVVAHFGSVDDVLVLRVSVFQLSVTARVLLQLHAVHSTNTPTFNWQQKIAAFIRRSKRQLDDFNSLCDTADTQLFTKILHNPHSVLQALLPSPADRNYNLRDRLHNRQLPGRMSHLTDRNFIVRMLFCDSKWLTVSFYLVLHCTIAVWQLLY